MTTTLDRAIEDAKARGIAPTLIEALRSLVEKGTVEVRQMENGAFQLRATEVGRKYVQLGGFRRAAGKSLQKTEPHFDWTLACPKAFQMTAL